MDYGPIFNFDDLLNGEEKNKTPKGQRSELIGNILQGIPGVSGFPITQEAEDELARQRMVQPEPTPEPIAPVAAKPTATSTRKTIKPKADIPQAKNEDIPVSRAKPVELMPFGEPDQEAGAVEPVSAAPQEAPKTIEAPVDTELLDAQQQRKNMLLLQALIRAGNTIGTSIAGTKADPNYLREYDTLIAEPMTSLQERRALEKEKKAAERQAKIDAREEEKFGLDKRKGEQDIERQALYMQKLQAEMEDEQALRDPNSLISAATREFQKQRMAALAKASNGTIKFDPSVLDGMSAARMEASLGKATPENLAGMLAQVEARKDAREESRRRHEESMAMRKESQEWKQKEDVQKQTERYTNMVQKSDPFKESERIVLATAKVKELAKDAALRGGQSLAMLGPVVAKGLAGEVGVLTDKDVTRYTQNPSLAGGLVDTLNKVKAGKLSQVSYDNLMRLTEIMEKKALANRELAYAKGATQLSRNSNIPYERAYELLNPNFTPGQQVPTVDSLGAPQQTYSEREEAGIANVMRKNPGATREQVIKELKAAGRIK